MAGTGINWTVMPGDQRVLAMSLVILTKSKYVKFVSKRYECLKLQGLGKIHNLCEKQDIRSLQWICLLLAQWGTSDQCGDTTDSKIKFLKVTIFYVHAMLSNMTFNGAD
jgi:hypothetical protein